jgi:hypothetical protein
MKKNSLLTIVVLASTTLSLTACRPISAATSVVPTPVSVIPTATSQPTQTPTITPSPLPTDAPTATSTLSPLPTPTPGGPVWQILFRGAPCSEMVNPGCQPFDDTPFYFYLLNSDGTDLERVEGVPPGSYLVQLSPDGTRLAYTGPDSGFYLAEADGSNPTRVLDNVISFDFSPDGEYLYYSSQEVINDDPGHFEMQANIGRIRIDGSENSVLAMLLATEGVHVRLSPDGEWILAWGESKETVRKHLLYLVAAGDGTVQLLFEGNSIGSACWSVDGTVVQFVEWHKEAGSCVNVFHTVDRDDHSLRSTSTVTGFNTCLAWGDWSPDRQEFAFAVHPEGSTSELTGYDLA